jgi:hypothetical protein
MDINQFKAKKQIRPVIFNKKGQLLILREKGSETWRLPEGEFNYSTGTDKEISSRAREIARSQTGIPIEYVADKLSVPFNEGYVVPAMEEGKESTTEINQITIVPMLGEGDFLGEKNIEAGWMLVRDAAIFPTMEDKIKEAHNELYTQGLFINNSIPADFTTNRVIGTSN